MNADGFLAKIAALDATKDAAEKESIPAPIYVEASETARVFFGTQSDFDYRKGEMPPFGVPFDHCVVGYWQGRCIKADGTYLDTDAPRATRILSMKKDNGQRVHFATAYAPDLRPENRGEPLFLCSVLFGLDEKGVPISLRPDGQFGFILGNEMKTALEIQGVSRDGLVDVTWAMFGACFYVLAVACCKNIDIVRASGARPRDRRLGFHMDFRRLEIRGSTRVHATEEQTAPVTRGVARHYCRGHFSDYREGKGLFGKYHGIYWTPPTWKGRTEHGVVHKSYSIKPPETGT